MAVEGEDSLDPVVAHEREGSAVGEADALVREFLEKDQRLAVLAFARPQNRESSRVEDVPRSLGREGIARPPREKREGFRKDQGAGKGRRTLRSKLIPSGNGTRMKAIFRDVAREEGARVDEDQSASP